MRQLDIYKDEVNGIISVPPMPRHLPYKPECELVNWRTEQVDDCPPQMIMGFYSHELAEADILKNRWTLNMLNYRTANILVNRIISRSDAKGEFPDGFDTKNLYIEAECEYV